MPAQSPLSLHFPQASQSDEPQWLGLQKKILATWSRLPAPQMFEFDAGAYRWGWATATDSPIDAVAEGLSRLAMTNSSEPFDSEIQWVVAAEEFLGSPRQESFETVAAMRSVLWASAMPMLSLHLPTSLWWEVLNSLQLRWANCDDDPGTLGSCRLIGAGELGLTLAWRLAALPSCARLKSNSLAAVKNFMKGEDLSIDEVLRRPLELRLIVGSILRCERLIQKVAKRKFKQDDRDMAFDLSSWMAAMTRHDGTSAWSNITRDHAVDDVDGLFKAATTFDEDSLRPAIAASLGESQSGGRLAWEVSLPESMWHSEQAGQAILLPEWDVRRGRTFVDFHGTDVKIEIMGGRCLVFRGTIETTVTVGGEIRLPSGPWQNSCDFTDDDVHYLEIEQAYEGGLVLQRQFMVVRDDRCVLIADAVLPADNSAMSANLDAMPIRCVTKLPLASAVRVTTDKEVRELFLSTTKNRAIAIPLAGSEWRTAMSDSFLETSDDGRIVLDTRGVGAVYSPLWLDFQARRFRRKRTWRQLTVADQLSTVRRNEAAAFRVQVGSEHWIVYRSMRGLLPRSFLGRHLAADFFAARFHPGDGGMEELVTVDNES